MSEKKTKASYEAMGYRDALQRKSPTYTGASWQSLAYADGYKRGATERVANSALPSDGIDIARMPANTQGWPQAAAHHALCLAADMNTERDPHRRRRLSTALGRMQQRYASINPGARA